jgi:hypothetical protein
VHKARWLILILGPAPIVGSSWAVSAWLRPQPRAMADRNDVVATMSDVFGGESPRPFALAGESQARLLKSCHESAMRLAQQLGPGGHVLERAPFVLGGDLSDDELARWHDETIEPAMQALGGRYFRDPPRQPVTVLLFADENSYNAASQRLFGESGVSVYGYYRPNQRTLLLNAATGAGTLLHELTHALVDFDFSDAPQWFNEGLASLHEQCRFREDQRGPWIEGLPNWRLRGLQNAIRDGRLRPLAAMIAEADFHGALEGTNYAQARYFCLYMQQKGLLEEFYRRFRACHAHDPTGEKTLANLFSATAWQRVDADFQRWVQLLSE